MEIEKSSRKKVNFFVPGRKQTICFVQKQKNTEFSLN